MAEFRLSIALRLSPETVQYLGRDVAANRDSVSCRLVSDGCMRQKTIIQEITRSFFVSQSDALVIDP